MIPSSPRGGMRVVVGKRNRRHRKVPPILLKRSRRGEADFLASARAPSASLPRRLHFLGNCFEKPFQFAASSRVTQFSQGFGFDLTDSFACHTVLLSDLF